MKFHSLLRAALPFLLGSTLFAQSPFLLKDINTLPKANPSSSPTGYWQNYHTPWDNYHYPKIGPFLYFAADDGKVGRELFKSLPAPNTITLVKDINPAGNSYPSNFIVVNNILFFSANDGKNGTEPWRSDGTASGTFMLKDCRAGSMSGNFYYPVALGNKVYWTSYNGSSYDLWVSDGTQAGTKIVYSGFRYAWNYPLVLGNKIVFRGSDTANGGEPWVTDGTKAGTKLLADTRPGSASGYFYYPVLMGNKVYWCSYTGSGYTLYETDGTPSGTKAVYAGFTSPWYYPVVLGNKIVFRGKTSTAGYEPWVTDGTQAGTKMIADLRPGTASSYPYNMVVFKNAVYFQAYQPSGSTYAIWKTDGTPTGTKVVSTKTRYFSYPTVLGSTIFFRGWNTAQNNGYELWKTDGTDKGTQEVMDIYPGSGSSYPSYLTSVLGGNRLVFSANDGKHGTELWISDGTAAGTMMLKDLYGGNLTNTRDSYPYNFIDVSGLTYFTANDGKTGTELYVTDGTPAGTRLVKDLNPGSGPGADLYYSKMNYWRYDGTWEPTALGNILIFRGYSPSTGYEVFRTDGTPGGTKLLKDINPGPASGYYYYGCRLGGLVYFFARDTSGYALWRTDGTSTGTVKVKGGFSSYWYYPVPYGNKIFFTGFTTTTGREPWITDGTPAGTMMLKDIRPGSSSAYAYDPVVMGGKVYFRSYKSTGGGYDLWVTDGTPSGTKLLVSLNGYAGYYMTAMGGKLFFQGRSTTSGAEIWVSDGTPAGTKLLKDINPGSGSGYFNYPCVVGNTLFFRANDGTSGYELWKTDGTPNGTVLVKNILSGSGSSYPGYLTPIGSRKIVFQANDGSSGTELWVSDGTGTGTRRVMDIFPGSSSSSPYQFTLSGGKVIFRARNGALGYEPWAWFPGATAKSYGRGTGAAPRFTSTDPVLGKVMTWTLAGIPKGQVALALLCAPTHAPTRLGNGWLYFNLRRIFAGFAMVPSGGGATATLKLPVPNSPALTGFSMASQAFSGPSSTPPIGIDFSNGLLLTFGN